MIRLLSSISNSRMVTDSKNIDKKAPGVRRESGVKISTGSKTKGKGKDKKTVLQADTCKVCRTDFIEDDDQLLLCERCDMSA